MTQPTLFDIRPPMAGNLAPAGPAPSVPTMPASTRARCDDLDSSHEAAAASARFRQGHFAAIIAVLAESDSGLTAHQISRALGGELDNVQVNRRLSEMESAGLVLRLDKRTCPVTGRAACPVMLTVQGRWYAQR